MEINAINLNKKEAKIAANVNQSLEQNILNLKNDLINALKEDKKEIQLSLLKNIEERGANEQMGTRNQIQQHAIIEQRKIMGMIGADENKKNKQTNNISIKNILNSLTLQTNNPAFVGKGLNDGINDGGGWVRSNPLNVRIKEIGTLKLLETQRILDYGRYLSKRYGTVAFGLAEGNELKVGYVISNEKEIVEVVDEFLEDEKSIMGMINDKKYGDSKQRTKLNKKEVVLLSLNPNGIGDIARNLTFSQLKLYYEWEICGTASLCISKLIAIIKDENQFDDEIETYMDATSPVMKMFQDAKNPVLNNKFKLEKIGDGVAENLMKLIEFFKGFEEVYNKDCGKPSAKANNSKLSGEFVASQGNAVYTASDIETRLKYFAIELKLKLGIETGDEEEQKLTNYFFDLKNGGEEHEETNQKDNNNAGDGKTITEAGKMDDIK